MISPNNVETAVALKLNTNKATLGITKAEIISEDAEESKFRPPYCAVFADFQEPSDNTSADTVQMEVPCEIKVLCASSEKKSAALAFAEAFQLANDVVNLLRGEITVTEGDTDITVFLFSRKKPFDIMRKAADGSVVQVNLYYLIDSVGA